MGTTKGVNLPFWSIAMQMGVKGSGRPSTIEEDCHCLDLYPPPPPKTGRDRFPCPVGPSRRLPRCSRSPSPPFRYWPTQRAEPELRHAAAHVCRRHHGIPSHSHVQLTVTATASSGVAVDCLDASNRTLADADANATGFQVDLAVGETVSKVRVTNDAATGTCTATVERDSAQLSGWTPARDVNALQAAGNASPQGISTGRTPAPRGSARMG